MQITDIISIKEMDRLKTKNLKINARALLRENQENAIISSINQFLCNFPKLAGEVNLRSFYLSNRKRVWCIFDSDLSCFRDAAGRDFFYYGDYDNPSVISQDEVAKLLLNAVEYSSPLEFFIYNVCFGDRPYPNYLWKRLTRRVYKWFSSALCGRPKRVTTF
jgi:hypothetical protein